MTREKSKNLGTQLILIDIAGAFFIVVGIGMCILQLLVELKIYQPSKTVDLLQTLAGGGTNIFDVLVSLIENMMKYGHQVYLVGFLFAVFGVAVLFVGTYYFSSKSKTKAKNGLA
jgi:hypothetical protein